MRKVSIWFLLAFFYGAILLPSFAPAGKKKVQWQPVSAMAKQLPADGKPVIVDVYTDWCTYCKLMDATTWQHDSVVQYIHTNYVPVKLNAERKDSVLWEGEVFRYQPKYKVHQLAVKLLRGNMVYPSTVIIPAKGEWQVIPGAIKPKDLELVLKYYGSRANEQMDFVSYQRQFSGKWK
ncbi:MAG: thioredoxin family protein [Bacteroidetes bacterium]|uniref:thioredoxin family protein n=1 Tax=Phnomibacter sp. TaxID=2836217 RepID=UPI002FDCE232|nr:thioredoxin family protein [Bacteroidota bacterium]